MAITANRVKGTIDLSDTNYEALGYADVLGKKGRLSGQLRPLMLYVTTTDTNIGKSLKREFDLNLVVLAQAFVGTDGVDEECTCDLWLSNATSINVKKVGELWYTTPKNKMKLDAKLIERHR